MANDLDLEHFFGGNAVFIEELYRSYAANPSSVSEEWQALFADIGTTVEAAVKSTEGAPWQPKKNRIIGVFDKALEKGKSANDNVSPQDSAAADTIRAMLLIRGFRERGHKQANLDPLGLEEKQHRPELDYRSYGFSEEDLGREIFLGGELNIEKAPLQEIINVLTKTYCGNIGFEFEYIENPEQKEWLRSKIEPNRATPNFSVQEKREIYETLAEVEGFEQFVHVKFIGAKRFSLEGGDALIPVLNAMVEESAKHGTEDVIIGMPHRGRLNVITSVMKEPYHVMFSKFFGTVGIPDYLEASGDVKYHMGGSHDAKTKDGKLVHLSLTPNPSHLEAVNSVVMGKTRAKQDIKQDTDRSQAMSVLLHGDAAFAGQGSVPEGILLSVLDSYQVGGTAHIVVNNQVGFTTNPENGRPSDYPTDVAKMVEAPIFHVNGDDPEACCYIAKIAAEYRAKFKKDFVIDIVCYRRYGHNESDEPMFTQPLMYQKIKQHQTPRAVYAQRLAAEGTLTKEDAEAKVNIFKDQLNTEFEQGKDYKPNKADWLEGGWAGLKEDGNKIENSPKTGVDEKVLKKVGKALSVTPEGFNVNKKIAAQLEGKKEMFKSGKGFDWATGEALAFGSLLLEGSKVRLSGQDCERGTFSHRHSVLNDQKQADKKYTMLNNIDKKQANFEVINSPLSEFAVMGFEYGYAQAEPNALVMWEGQFGDFSNGAQVIIDQFISSGEKKWLRMNGVVLLLPHGYEGQGPEHSSARLERYLQLCAENSMIVANCTTPASYFHILRRQMAWNYRKPLVIMTPKSLLRHKMAVSELKEFAKNTSFQPVLGEAEKLTNSKVRKAVLCSGKVYYDLLEQRKKKDVAIIRLEQLYPFPAKELAKELKKYANLKQVVWCQEEPENMGAWHYIDRRIEGVLTDIKSKAKRPIYVGRSAAASPATGYLSVHNQEQAALLKEALK